MRMIPDAPYRTKSRAELRLFDKLRNATLDDNGAAWTAFHSLNLTRHQRKRFGEIDFLLCGPRGLFVLEVKGGRVACTQGVWRFTDRFDEESSSLESPFRQAESALHGLLTRLREQLPAPLIDQFSVGFGVVFPDCLWPLPGAEWDPHTLADARGYQRFDHWLQQLIRYWRKKDGGNRAASADALQTLQQFLRPEFETATPLYIQALQAEEEIARLTADQIRLVDVLSANRRVLCSGGAGTGKTFLAMELARRWTSQGKRVLLACHSPWLCAYLSSRFAIPGLVVAQVGTVAGALRRAGISVCDCLIVDEGQDLFDLNSLGQLDAVLKDGLADGRWCLLHDVNNQSGILNHPDPEALAYLHSLNPARVPLTTNCRNTRVILDKIQTTLGVDMGTRGAGVGPSVREQTAASMEQAGRLLAAEINSIINEGGISPGQVTLLSPVEFAASSAARLPEKLRQRIWQLDEFSLKRFPLQQMTFTTVSRFKGLENEAVILIDVAPIPAASADLATHYVGMSRARSLLSIIYRRDLVVQRSSG
ncbi:MAG: NERD domain-containing protein [Chromatiaceae bacterium]|nr:NERD domain-containing protein [Chromatiaceae bacterium]